MSRDSVAIDCQLQTFRLTNEEFFRAKKLWMQFANDYGVPPDKLRANDRIADIVQTDFFGDRGLYFEKLLTDKGIKNFPIGDATLEYLIRQLL